MTQYTEREDLFVEDFHSFVARVLGVFSMVVSYHESIVFLCLSRQALNASILLRTQLEAHLILCYLINPSENLEEVEQRVHEYQDWVCIKMYLNSKKSKDFDLFTLNPTHSLYLQQVEENYARVKAKYNDNLDRFKELEKSQSFLKNKREVAKQNDIEDLYMGVFSETSATVHLADISDRMIEQVTEEFDGYRYEFGSANEAMMMVGISNLILTKSITMYFNFLKIPKGLQRSLLRKIKITRKTAAAQDGGVI